MKERLDGRDFARDAGRRILALLQIEDIINDVVGADVAPGRWGAVAPAIMHIGEELTEIVMIRGNGVFFAFFAFLAGKAGKETVNLLLHVLSLLLPFSYFSRCDDFPGNHEKGVWADLQTPTPSGVRNGMLLRRMALLFIILLHNLP